MKLKTIETFTNEFVCFVRATAEDGSQGWGQVAPYYADITAQVVHRQVAPYALGMDCFDIDAILELVRDREHKFPGSYLRRAMGAPDRSQPLRIVAQGFGMFRRSHEGAQPVGLGLAIAGVQDRTEPFHRACHQCRRRGGGGIDDGAQAGQIGGFGGLVFQQQP